MPRLQALAQHIDFVGVELVVARMRNGDEQEGELVNEAPVVGGVLDLSGRIVEQGLAKGFVSPGGGNVGNEALLALQEHAIGLRNVDKSFEDVAMVIGAQLVGEALNGLVDGLVGRVGFGETGYALDERGAYLQVVPSRPRGQGRLHRHPLFGRELVVGAIGGSHVEQSNVVRGRPGRVGHESVRKLRGSRRSGVQRVDEFAFDVLPTAFIIPIEEGFHNCHLVLSIGI